MAKKFKKMLLPIAALSAVIGCGIVYFKKHHSKKVTEDEFSDDFEAEEIHFDDDFEPISDRDYISL